MAQEAAITYKCDRCGKTAQEEPVPPRDPNDMGGGIITTAPTGWNNVQARNLRTMDSRAGDMCDTCSAEIFPSTFWSKTVTTVTGNVT